MKVKLPNSDVQEIGYGDVFENTGNGNIYLLMRHGDLITLKNFKGDGCFDSYTDSGVAKAKIRTLIEEGTLKHYSQDKYDLVLQFKQ